MILPKAGDVIRHKDAMDCAILLTQDCQLRIDGGISVTGLWYNMGYARSWIINSFREYGKVRAHIKAKNVGMWFISEDPTATCVRNTNWKAIA